MYSAKIEKLAADIAYQQALIDHGIAQHMTDVRDLESRLFGQRLDFLHQKREEMEEDIEQFFEEYIKIGRDSYVREGLFGKQTVRDSLSMIKSAAKRLKKVIKDGKDD